MHKYRIPFNIPYLAGNEYAYISEALEKGHISGDGSFTMRCQEILKEQIGVKHALLTTSCTHALEMMALLINIQPGDEVIVPSFTFVSTINAFVLRGARPVFIDIREDTKNMDEKLLADLITPKTKAIVPVHYAGVGCEMDAILEIAGEHNIPVLEDNAHGLFGKYKGRNLGTFGCMAAQSFHETKNISAGECGALLINDDAYIDRADIIREKGTNRKLFLRGQIDKYSWADIGSSYLPSDIIAAFLCAQLEEREKIQTLREKIWKKYEAELRDWAVVHGVALPQIPDCCEQAYHMFYLILPSQELRAALIRHLKARDILSVFHYVPLHLSTFAQQYGGKPGDCPVTEDISDRLLRLPFYNALTEDEQASVVTALKEFDWRAS
ncbi:MAG: dTDP-4-amino-4,6-dideoxygalactose transaminase [Planctomycetes bacterium]|nr:dTDP-4-amino-4,6-dideoxygalactose transaminase [Planctomycetota bacterium]